MGLIQFLVPDPRRMPADAAARAHLTSLEGVPVAARVVRTDRGLIADRPKGESATFHVPWLVEGQGEVTLSTTSLMERARPYNLPVELARGTLSRFRNQRAAWEGAGMEIPPAVADGAHAAMEAFRRAILSTDAAVAGPAAEESIGHSLRTTDLLSAAYVHQVLTARHRQTPRLPTLFGVALPDAPLQSPLVDVIAPAFNSAVMSLRWSRIEAEEGRFDWSLYDSQVFWCQSQGLRVCGGPLIALDADSLPAWLEHYAGDIERLLFFVGRFVQQAVTRYQGRVHLWLCAGRVAGDTFALREEQKLRIVLRAVESVRRYAPQVPATVMLDLPWAEHMLHRELQLSPLHYADSLVRADIGLAGVGLEINLGYFPGGTQLRDLLAFSLLIDRWSMFNLPLLVSLTIPSSDVDDPLASSTGRPLSRLSSSGVNAAAQAAWIEKLVPFLIAKQSVQGVFWNTFTDTLPHEFPHSGLMDPTGQPKGALDSLRLIRQQHLV